MSGCTKQVPCGVLTCTAHARLSLSYPSPTFSHTGTMFESIILLKFVLVAFLSKKALFVRKTRSNARASSTTSVAFFYSSSPVNDAPSSSPARYFMSFGTPAFNRSIATLRIHFNASSSTHFKSRSSGQRGGPPHPMACPLLHAKHSTNYPFALQQSI